MKISWMRYKKDNDFNIIKKMGLDVFDIEELEKTDEKLGELIKNKYDTIIISNKVASFSGDIIKKYEKSNDVNIIIMPNYRR
jgi:vacuolar-type H+-ATPase subunit F/Vma7